MDGRKTLLRLLLFFFPDRKFEIEQKITRTLQDAVTYHFKHSSFKTILFIQRRNPVFFCLFFFFSNDSLAYPKHYTENPPISTG